MQKIFWIGSPFFQAALSGEGWHVHCFNFEQVAVFSWENLLSMAGFEPDVVVVADKSRPPFVLGQENFPCFTVFYAVDTHIHSWYPHYAQSFDACIVSLKDHIPLFHHKYLDPERVRWFPAFAKDSDLPKDSPAPQDPLWDCLFVGTINAQTTPQRKVFLEHMQKRVSLHCAHGNYVELFPQGKVILNQCEHGDLNFRVFEALGCGTCLVTPNIGHGLTEIFTPNRHLACYEPHNIEDAAKKIDYLLAHESQRKSMAECGLAAINAGHRAQHRARAFTEFLDSITTEQKQIIINTRRKKAATLRSQWLRPFLLLLANAVPQELLRKAYLDAARGIFGNFTQN